MLGNYYYISVAIVTVMMMYVCVTRYQLVHRENARCQSTLYRGMPLVGDAVHIVITIARLYIILITQNAKLAYNYSLSMQNCR